MSTRPSKNANRSRERCSRLSLRKRWSGARNRRVCIGIVSWTRLARRNARSVVRRLRELQLQDQGRTANRRNLLHTARGTGADRVLAPPLKSPPTALLARLQTAGTTSRFVRTIMAAVPCRRVGTSADFNRRTLTYRSGHLDGVGQIPVPDRTASISPPRKVKALASGNQISIVV